MTEPKNGRPIFFPENLVLFGNLALFLWIVLDSVAFLLYDFTAGIVFFILEEVENDFPNPAPADEHSAGRRRVAACDGCGHTAG